MPVSARVAPTHSIKRAASYARMSCELQDARSLRDQQRKCNDRAARDGCEIIREFTDEALSGANNDRPGYLAFLDFCRTGAVDVAYVESLSRLSRDALESQRTLLDLSGNLGVRVVTVDDGVDTAQENWELLAGIHGHQNQQYLRTLSRQVKRAQDGVVLEGLCIGDTRFGYSSEPVEDSSRRRGRDVKPKRRYVIHAEQAKWVAWIFARFTVDRWSLKKISQELNRQKVTRDARSLSDKWTPATIRAIVGCPKYAGVWEWGRLKNTRNPITGKKRQVSRPDTSPEIIRREIPELAIIDRATFEEAGRRLQEFRLRANPERDSKGRLKGSSPSPQLREAQYLLSGLIECAGCGRRMVVVGASSRYFKCSNNREGNCECSTQLPRRLAEQKVLEQLGDRLFENERAIDLLLDEVQGLIRLTEKDVDETARLEQEVHKVQRTISSLLDLYEASGNPDIVERLNERTRDKRELVSQLEASRRSAPTARSIVTREWVKQQLGQLAEVLNGEAAVASPLLASVLVGGKIVAEEIPVPGMKNKFIRISFAIDLQASASRMLGTKQSAPGREPTDWVELDIRQAPPYEQVADQVVELHNQGLPYKEIADRVGFGVGLVGRAYAYWHKARGLKAPYGRADSANRKPSDEVHALRQKVIEKFDEGLLYYEIAAALDCTLCTVQKHIAEWHSERGLPMPNGNRRGKAISNARKLVGKKGLPSGSDEKPKPPSFGDPPELGVDSQPIAPSCAPRDRAG